MEWKIGEIKQINGEWYQCVKSDDTCNGCVGKFQPYSFCHGFKECVGKIFKKLEKVGEPYTHYCPSGRIIYFQRYKIFNKSYSHNTEYIMCDFNKDSIVSIEIKQNKEDMEENKLNLKPFDIQKAREGKPVCTRDGRKVRIICFDAKGDPCPIIALVEENGIESAYHYDKNGQNAYNKSKLDLMMLPEKKEGWVNIVRGSNGSPHMGRGIFQSKEEAENTIKAFSDNLIDTVKISWEE